MFSATRRLLAFCIGDFMEHKENTNISNITSEQLVKAVLLKYGNADEFIKAMKLEKCKKLGIDTEDKEQALFAFDYSFNIKAW